MRAKHSASCRATGRGRTGLRDYLFALVGLVLAPALLLGAATTRELASTYRLSEEAGLASTAEALATAIDREMEIALTALSTLAASPSLAAGNISDAYLQAQAVGRAFGGWVAMLEEDSTQVFNTRLPLGAPLPRGAGDPFVGRAISTGQPFVSDLFLGATAAKPVISTFQPLPPGTAGASAGKRRVLLLAFTPDRLTTLLERQHFEDRGGFAVLTDGNSRVVARSSEQARFLNQPSPEWFVRATMGLDEGLIRGEESLAGHLGLLAFQRLERAPSWVVAVVTPFEPFQGRWRGPALRYMAGSALLAGVAALLALLLARRILRPLRTLAQDADRLSQGGVPTSSSPERIAEIETLRQALWRLVSALRAQGAAEGRAAAAEESAAELGEAARRRDLLVAELNHRVKNMLATVQSLTSQTLRGSGDDPERFVSDLTGRLRTLAQAHDLLIKVDWEGADVDAVVAAALAPWQGDSRLSISGPRGVHLDSNQAQALVLALHELSTNAVKYGALSVESGLVEIRWQLRDVSPGDKPWLELRWRERGGPEVRPPTRSGFGSRLLEQGLPRQLKGEAVLSHLPEGVEYRLSAPVRRERGVGR
ncbi:sensor histidine kinase [Roseomonas sp. SSH11]|uniref:histidine kinase n=1 Tax=Pararoseomonas baculiformis TaxID=2820812 RepID=A0ABS4ADM3_9PROT|nr:sensor histidine kinase [Pararoseomonas baculiformis]MBP0445107.1 sensor histidine kinase [Pararoseomonas baculiformis]